MVEVHVPELLKNVGKAELEPGTDGLRGREYSILTSAIQPL